MRPAEKFVRPLQRVDGVARLRRLHRDHKDVRPLVLDVPRRPPRRARADIAPDPPVDVRRIPQSQPGIFWGSAPSTRYGHPSNVAAAASGSRRRLRINTTGGGGGDDVRPVVAGREGAGSLMPFAARRAL